jgi:hypothetical protein
VNIRSAAEHHVADRPPFQQVVLKQALNVYWLLDNPLDGDGVVIGSSNAPEPTLYCRPGR